MKCQTLLSAYCHYRLFELKKYVNWTAKHLHCLVNKCTILNQFEGVCIQFVAQAENPPSMQIMWLLKTGINQTF